MKRSRSRLAGRRPLPGARFGWLAALLLFAATGCTDPTGSLGVPGADRISAQRALWESQNIDDYTFETRRLCFCGFVGWLEVTVEGGVVQSITVLEQEDVPASVAEEYPTVDELFDILAEAVEKDAVRIDVTWHETLGYPETFYIDYSRNIADEELGHDIRLLSPTP